MAPENRPGPPGQGAVGVAGCRLIGADLGETRHDLIYCNLITANSAASGPSSPDPSRTVPSGGIEPPASPKLDCRVRAALAVCRWPIATSASRAGHAVQHLSLIHI